MKLKKIWGHGLGPAIALSMIALVPGALGAAASASVLYVDGANVSCSNTGSGAIEQPFCTISAAAAKVTAGQTVQVAAGTYPEKVVIPTSGTSSAPIVFTAALGATVTLSGQVNGFSITGKSWITINGFTVTGTSGNGILVSGSSYITIAGNHISYSGQPVSGYQKTGIALSNTTDSLVSGNTAHHNTYAGIELKGGSTRDEVRNNVTFNNAQQFQRAAPGIRLYASPGNIVDGNVSHDNEDSGIEAYPGSNNTLIYNNVSYNNGDHGIDDLTCTGQRIIANTTYKNVTAGINVEGNSTGAALANNISVDNGIKSPRTHSDIRIENGSTAGTTLDYDLVYLSTADTIMIWSSVSYSSLAAFQAASGQETHGIQASPQWRSPAAGDFHLTAGSPAIDSANSGGSGQPSTDVEGNARVDDPAVANTGVGPRAYDDRGAYEFMAGGQLDHIVISPSSATIGAGASQASTAEGFDASNNSLGNVTSSTTFSISPDGSCSGASCTATTVGPHTVTGNDAGKTSTASLTVTAGALDHLVLAPASATIAASGSQVYTAEGRDQYNNSLGDVTASTTFSISPDGTCTGASCTATVAGPHTVTGTKGGKTGTASLTVTAGALDHLVLAPASATITAGSSQAYAAEGRDQYNNSLGDVTSTTTFSISPDGTCTGASCTATVAGPHTVTGTKGGKTGTASLTVTAGALDHLVLAPASATVTAGSSQAYAAEGRDQYNNSLGDVTSTTTFAISPNGSCTGAACSASATGAHTVTGSKSGKSGTASLTVTAGALDHLVLAPASATMAAGGSQSYTVEGFDASNNSLGDVTASTTFSIAADGSCTGASCTASVAGAHTVTGTKSGKTGTASLQVNAAAVDHIVISPASATIGAGGSQAYTAEGFDSSGNSLGDVTAFTTFSISPNGTCTGASCTATAAGAHTVTGNYSGKTSTASLAVSAGPLDHLVLSPASATVAAGGSQAYTAEGFDASNNSLGDVTAATTFSIAPDGSCAGGSCSASVAGAHTVTGNDGGKTGTASLSVTVGALDHLVLAPASATIAAGGSQGYTAEGRDLYENSLGDVTASTTFSITPNGSCTGASCTASVSGAHTVTGTKSGKTGTASLQVTASGVLDHIVVSPSSATIGAGGSQSYSAEGFDSSGNSLGDVTAFTTFSVTPNGTCTGASCTATVAGAHTVTGNDGGKTSTASLSVTVGALDHLALAPASATIPSGGSQVYTAEGRDQYDNSLGDVTATTAFSIAPNGSCTGATCTASLSGAHTVTGTKSGKSGTASLQVGAGGLDHIVISPSSATISVGGSQAYTAQGFDASNNSLGDVTAATTFSIAPNGSCTGAVCTANTGGSHTVTGNDAGKTSTASLAVSFVRNPGFETDTSGWNTSGSGTGITLTRVSGGHSGSWAAQLTNTGTTATTCLLNDSPDWARPTSAGTYTGSLWVRADTAGKPLKLRFREYSISSGALLGTTTAQVTLTTSWQQVTVSYTITAPGSTLDFNAYLSSADAPPGTCFYADDAAVLLP